MLFGNEIVYDFRGNRKSKSSIDAEYIYKKLQCIAKALSNLVPPFI